MYAALEDGTREWLDELGEVSVDALVWQPFRDGHSVGSVILHIAEVEVYWIEEVAAGRPMSEADLQRFLSAEIRQYDVSWPKAPAQPLDYYLGMLKDVRQRTLATLRELNDPTGVISWRNETVTLRWILAHVVEHESYHGGQAVLLRLMWDKRGAND